MISLPPKDARVTSSYDAASEGGFVEGAGVGGAESAEAIWPRKVCQLLWESGFKSCTYSLPS